MSGLILEWSGPVVREALLGVHLTGWDFYFLLSATCGLYALHLLAYVPAERELRRSAMIELILAQAHARFSRPPAVGGADPPADVSGDLVAGRPE